MLMKVKLTKKCWAGSVGDVKQIHIDGGEQLIKDRFAVEIESDVASREARQAESLELQNKAFAKRDKEAQKEAKNQEKSKRDRKRDKVDNKALSAKE